MLFFVLPLTFIKEKTKGWEKVGDHDGQRTRLRHCTMFAPSFIQMGS